MCCQQSCYTWVEQIFPDTADRSHGSGKQSWIVVVIRSHPFSRRNLAPGFRSFSMVRHPCERFISAFTYTLTVAPEPELRWHHKSLSLTTILRCYMTL